MTGQGIFVFIAVLAMIGILIRDKMRPGMVLFTFVVLFLVGGIITPAEALSGFSNKGMITVALLFLVSEGVSRSGTLNAVTEVMRPRRKIPISKFLAKILIPVSSLSAFLNNTPMVVIFAPLVRRWAEDTNIPYKKLLIPLSYATILGGMCTLIGTSTNLVVDGLMQSNGYKGLGMFELAKIGIPIAGVGLVYLIFFSKYLLPKARRPRRVPLLGEPEFKEYLYSIRILEECSLTKTQIVDGCIDALPEVEVRSVFRDKQWTTVNGQPITVEANDIMVVAGKSTTLKKLLGTKGVRLSCLENADAHFVRNATKQVEVVIANRFPGIGLTLQQFDFYRHYGAKVMAVHRNGERITDSFDNLCLRRGDNLVLVADDSFIKTWGESSVFHLLTEKEDVSLCKKSAWKRYTAAVLMLVMVVGAAFEVKVPGLDIRLDMFSLAAVTAVIMAWLNMYPANKYTKFVSWDILITIASAFAISKAMVNSGMAEVMARNTIGLVAHWGPHAVLAILFIITSIFTEVITNNAAAALLFPIAMATSNQLGVNPTPMFITVMIAASASFLTPIGYQTNLIVQNVGGYRFKDFVKVGLPLSLIVFIISVYLIPIIWEF